MVDWMEEGIGDIAIGRRITELVHRPQINVNDTYRGRIVVGEEGNAIDGKAQRMDALKSMVDRLSL